MKKIISFDGDGTLWYPQSTKHTQSPHWVYEQFPIVEEANSKLILIPGALDILKYCKKNHITLILLSTNPNEPSLAQQQVEDRAKLLGVDHYFDHIISARDYPESKGEILADFIKENNFITSDILHIGDSYNRDYCSVQSQGIDSLLIKTDYMKEDHPFAVEYTQVLKHIQQLTS